MSTVDTTRPTPPIVTASMQYRALMTFQGASDNIGIEKFEAWDAARYLKTLGKDVAEYLSPPLAAGPHPLRIVAYDAAGNLANSNNVLITVPDMGLVPVKAEIPAIDLPGATFKYNRLVFEELFDGPLNLSRWSPYGVAGGTTPGHAENGIRDPNNWRVEGNISGANGGCLVGTAYWDAAAQKIRAPGMSHKLNYTYGRFQCRMRTEGDPDKRTESNFLTWPGDNIWPMHGENNIWETSGSDPLTRSPMRSYVHFGNDPRWGYDNRQVAFTHIGKRGIDWHTIDMEWSFEVIKIWVDGVLSAVTYDTVAVPDWPHHICLQLDAISNGFMRAPVKVYYDHVRIYQ